MRQNGPKTNLHSTMKKPYKVPVGNKGNFVYTKVSLTHENIIIFKKKFFKHILNIIILHLT